jgi:hypothetical protein
VKLLEVRRRADAETLRLAALIQTAARGSSEEVYLEFPASLAGLVSDDAADAFVPALLVPSLQTGEPLEIGPPVSPRLLGSLPGVQDILLSFYPELRRVEVRAAPRARNEAPQAEGVGSFFTGGVDSFYTLLKSLRGWPGAAHITHLVYLIGAERPLEECAGAEDTRRELAQVAALSGTTLVPIVTDLRSRFTLNWERYYHGAVMASAALSLAGGLREVHISSSYSYVEQHPWGSHPLLDGLWSSERVQIVHDGAEAKRSEKLERLVGRDPLALAHLRVCLHNASGASNCGRCRKCVRTMLGLELLGTLSRARLFEAGLPRELDELVAQDEGMYGDELLELARRTGTRPDLERRLRRAVRRRARRRALRAFAEQSPPLDALLRWIDGRRRRRGSVLL